MNNPKFQFLYKGLPCTSTDSNFNWHKKTYFLSEFIDTNLNKLSDVHETSTLIATRQFTGLKDKNGTDIYDGDIVYAEYNYLGNIAVRFKSGVFNIASYVVGRCVVVGNKYQNPELLGESK